MKCAKCSCSDSKVNDSRLTKDGVGIRRRRECQECGYRFTTFERIETELPMVRKNDGRREPFDRDKLYRGVRTACEKRPISVSRIEKFIDKIELDISELGEKEIDSSSVGKLVMTGLKDLDAVAYVRFASVYREFQDVEEFVKEITSLLKK
jgi:transcriptional repressor NrdR